MRSSLYCQRREPRVDIFDEALAAPMTLGRKVDDVARIGQRAVLVNEHPARLNLLTLARLFVGIEIPWERILESKCDATPHDSDAIHRFDEGLGTVGQAVTASPFQKYQSLRISTAG
jgi:hypothetical protein